MGKRGFACWGARSCGGAPITEFSVFLILGGRGAAAGCGGGGALCAPPGSAG
jgi:hypothetical protein